MIRVYCDGSCLNKTKSGGTGVVILYPNGDITKIQGFIQQATNQQAELYAAISAIRQIAEGKATVHTDSQYVKNGITAWIYKWKQNGWKTTQSQPVKNRELWEELDYYINSRKLELTWRWVRGHNGDKWNEEADKLAFEAALKVAKGEI